MTMNDIFGDGEVLGALVTGLLLIAPGLVIMAYDKWKARRTKTPRTITCGGKIIECIQTGVSE